MPRFSLGTVSSRELFCSKKDAGVIPGRGELSPGQRKKFGNVESCACCLNLRLPPGGNPSLPGKFTGPVSQNFLTPLYPTSVPDLPLAPGPCLFSAGNGDWSLMEVSRSGPETHTHLVIFMASGGGVGMTTCSLRKIFTEVVFELIAKGRAGCQMCVRFGCGSPCAPEDLEAAPTPGGSRTHS